jgi:hypothetical protein
MQNPIRIKGSLIEVRTDDEAQIFHGKSDESKTKTLYIHDKNRLKNFSLDENS